MTSNFFILILGETLASAGELSKLRKFEPGLLCFAPAEVTTKHEGFLETSKKLGFTATDWNFCQEARKQAEETPQLTVILHKTATGQVNILSFRQAFLRGQNNRKSLLERLTEIEQMLQGCIQVNKEQQLLCQAIINPELKTKEQQWAQKLEQAMVQHLREAPLKVEELAAMACLSKRQLTRRVQAVLGVSPAQLIREVQLQMAHRELENGEPESVIQVALGCGFEHASTFSTLFKQRFGHSPRQYLYQ